MGTLQITVTGDASVGTKSRSWTISDANINRLIAWAQVAYATPPTEANPTPAPLTVAQTLNAWATGLLDGTRNNVIRWELDQARDAVASPAPIDAI